MSRLHTIEDILDVVLNTPGLGYVEGDSIIAIELNHISDERFAHILENIKSTALDFERLDNLIFLPAHMADTVIVSILEHIR
jgi:hypothetical protein